MPNGNDSPRVITRGVPETQIIEKREETDVTAVKNPVAQARHLALGWAGLVLSFIVAMLSFGPVVFWLGTFVIGSATFLWFLLQAARTEYVIEGKGTRVGVAPSEALAGFLVSVLVGGIAWSLWRVLSAVSVDIVLPRWLASWLPNLTALVSLIGLVFSIAYIIHLEPAFLQELLYRSPAIEQGIGNLVSQDKPPWWDGRVRVKEKPIPRPIPQTGRPTVRGNGAANDIERPPEDNTIPSAHSATSISGGMFQAPSGYTRARRDLAEFVETVCKGVKAPQLGAWESKAQGRNYEWWCDMIDTAALFGIVTKREGGKKVEVLRQDWQAALREIEYGLDIENGG